MKEINKDELENITNTKKAFVLFLTTWCGECENTKPIFEKIEKNNPDIIFFVIDVDKEKQWKDDYNSSFKIKIVPTFIGFKDGEEFFKETNFKSKSRILSLLEKFN